MHEDTAVYVKHFQLAHVHDRLPFKKRARETVAAVARVPVLHAVIPVCFTNDGKDAAKQM